MKSSELLEQSERAHFLLGNEAVVRGLYEAGVSVTATYPGTPSSEIGDLLYETHKDLGIYFEYSVNEKVAFEVAASASSLGKRAFVFMKHVGLNVAMDSFVSLGVSGVKGGFVILSADDPSLYSSQNEQDNRYLGKFAKYIVMEPSNPQELKDFVVKGFDISEATGQPVLIRSVTRVSHMRSVVKYGPVRNEINNLSKPDRKNTVLLPENSFRLQPQIFDRLKKVVEQGFSRNFINIEGEGEDLIITSGSAYNSIKEALEISGLKAKIMKIGISYPLDVEYIYNQIKHHNRIILIEEGGPFIEEQIYSIIAGKGIRKEVFGKITGDVPYNYEMNVDRVKGILAKIYGIPDKTEVVNIDLPSRPPEFCPGCPHRATYYAAKIALRQKGWKDYISPTDIGCYTLGYYDPYGFGDMLLSMGSSIGTSNGYSIFYGKKVITFIGDSTFFHAGIPPIINAVHNNHPMIVVILDNSTTAMTGGQPTPENMGNIVKIEDILKSIGVKNIHKTDPYDLKMTVETFKRAMDEEGVSVIISERECALEADRKKSKDEFKIFQVNQDKCKLCYNCVRNFTCAAFYIKDKRVYIDPELCDGCSVCSEPLVCPFGAIEVVK